MTPEMFRQASAIFLDVRGCPASRREELLDQRCGVDSELRRAVDALLLNDSAHQVDHQTQGLSDAVVRAAAEVFGQAPHDGDGVADPMIGTSVGTYRLLRRIGEGGMGTVYQAEQENPRRVVAVKVIRQGLMSRQLLRRFEHEAQVLGRLHHPGIAQIYEAGMDDRGEGGRPYFAMEFVNGLTLTAHLKNNEPDLRSRLELLARICDAVEHAHQKGVIHRDLKPANILVEAAADGGVDRAAPQPKVLDFGVARAIDSDIQATTLNTGAGQLIGTIAYMSPEQMAGDAAMIDTRSDVYALGVIGYEMLCGSLPFDVRGKSIPEAIRLISDSEATRLSAAHRVFRGDIETVIAKAMEKDPDRRYHSAADLAADVRRYLHDEPIIARPASTMYQVRKFARRNKALVGAVAVVFIVLVAGIIGTSVGLTRALDQARKAQRMNEYLRGMIAFLEPSQVKGREVTLQQVLDDAAQRVDAELMDAPDVAAEVLATIADGYFRLQYFEPAERHARRSLQLWKVLHGEADAQAAETWELLAKVQFHRDDLKGAADSFRKALSINLQHLDKSDSSMLSNLRDLTHSLQLLGRTEDIPPLLEQALALAQHLPETPDEHAAVGHHAMADMLATQHRLAEAEPFYRRSIDLHRKLPRQTGASRNYAVVLRDFAFLLELTQRLDESEALLREALDVCVKDHGSDHAETFLTMTSLLSTLRSQNKLDEAESLARETLAISTRLYGEDTTSAANALINLGTILRLRGKPGEAAPLFERAAAIRRNIQPIDEIELGKALSGFGASLVDSGRAAEAEPALREALAIRERSLPPNHPSLGMARSALGAAITARGGFADAEPLLLDAWQILRHAPNVAPQSRQETAARIVRLYEAWNKPDRADAFRLWLVDESPEAPPATQPGAVNLNRRR